MARISELLGWLEVDSRPDNQTDGLVGYEGVADSSTSACRCDRDVDGYFWGGEKELLMETAPKRTMDEYLWLGSRPVLSIRSKYNDQASWARFSDLNDWYTSCERRDETGTCRPNAIITDVIGKPVATIDSSRRVAGVLEYDPYGLTNHTEHWGEIAPHQNGGCWWVVSWMQQGNGPLVREARAVLPRVDLPAYIAGVQGGSCRLFGNDKDCRCFRKFAEEVCRGAPPCCKLPASHKGSCNGVDQKQKPLSLFEPLACQ